MTRRRLSLRPTRDIQRGYALTDDRRHALDLAPRRKGVPEYLRQAFCRRAEGRNSRSTSTRGVVTEAV